MDENKTKEIITALVVNNQNLGKAMKELDFILAAVRFLLVEKGIFTDEELASKVQHIMAAIEKAKEAAAAEDSAKEFKEETVEDELKKMEEVAKNVDTSRHPEDAFYFGG